MLLVALESPNLAADKTRLDNPQVLVVQGLSLQTLSWAAIEHTFGKAGPEHFSETRGSAHICYTDAQGSDTAIEFALGEVGSSFRIFRRTAARRESCRKSSIVTPTLTTGIGLKLGLSQAEVNRILGEPDRVKGDAAVWEYSASRVLTADEIQHIKTASPSATTPSKIDITTEITVQFVNARATSIRVAHSEGT
jgi:hypothetical protein